MNNSRAASLSSLSSDTMASASVEIRHTGGLHARPSVKLTKLAKSQPAEIGLAGSAEGPWIDAKSLIKVMGLKLKKGAVLHIRASGENAQEAVAAVVALVDQDFLEDEAADDKPKETGDGGQG